MKVSELQGAMLDYWVSQCNPEGRAPGVRHKLIKHSRGATCYYVGGGSLRSIFAPSTRWEHGGPIIERGKIAIMPDDGKGETWLADIGGWMSHDYIAGETTARGPTPLIAAMRCFVAHKFGPEVPDVKEM